MLIHEELSGSHCVVRDRHGLRRLSHLSQPFRFFACPFGGSPVGHGARLPRTRDCTKVAWLDLKPLPYEGSTSILPGQAACRSGDCEVKAADCAPALPGGG
jgi:hypothetical protein